MHHIAFAVEDVQAALNDAQAAGCQLMTKLRAEVQRIENWIPSPEINFQSIN